MTLSATVQLPDEAQVLLKTAIRMETPCGAGTMVWHVWGQETCSHALAPLVLLHGGSGSWTHWLRNILPLVESGRRVLVPDLPGFGDSAAPAHGTDADALPEPVEQGLNVLLGDAACDLVGFSFGGMVAGLLAAQFPARAVEQELQDWQSKSRGFPRPGLSHAEHVAPREDGRYGLSLNRGWA